MLRRKHRGKHNRDNENESETIQQHRKTTFEDFSMSVFINSRSFGEVFWRFLTCFLGTPLKGVVCSNNSSKPKNMSFVSQARLLQEADRGRSRQAHRCLGPDAVLEPGLWLAVRWQSPQAHDGCRHGRQPPGHLPGRALCRYGRQDPIELWIYT